MKVSSEQKPQREAVLNVELDEEDVEPYLQQAYQQIVRRASIPGFRKGKAPRRIIEQMFGREYLLNEALDSMVQEVTSKAVEKEKLELGGIPSVSIEQLDPPTFKATVPLMPMVDLGKYASVRVPRPKAKVEKDRVDSVLAQMSQEMAVWQPVKGAVQMDDLVNLTVIGWIDEGDERREVIRSENADYIPRPNTRFPVPDFDDALIGLPQKKLTKFTIDVPADFENADFAGKTAQFEATVHELKRKELPKIDDEFAKGVGDGYASLAELKKRVADDLQAQEERNAEAAHQEETLSKVVEMATVEMSPLIIDHELDHYIEDQAENIKAGRVTLQEYQQFLSWQGMSPEEVREEARPKVEERLKRAHVLREVVRRQNYEVTEADIDAEIELMAADAGNEAGEMRTLFQEEERRESLGRILLNRKALGHLTEIATKTGGAKAKAAKPKSKATATKRKPGGN
ncbi:MAG: trigger factor [Dehalococcoidia bacterium]